MKDPIAKLVPLLARGLAPTAAVASGLLSPIAIGASGDLDPDFADVGRLGPLMDFDGPAWSLQLPTEDEVLFAGGHYDSGCMGGGWYCYYEFEASGFAGRLSDSGSIDVAFDAAPLADTEVLDVALQPDGKAIAVGRTVQQDRSAITAFRMERDGSLDRTFGEDGVVRLPASANDRQHGSAVALDPDGRIVVAGSRNGTLVVLRLLVDGSLDLAFGGSGVFVGPPEDFAGARAAIVRTATGGYRIAANLRDFRSFSRVDSPCMLVGLTPSGNLDSAFGALGIARLEASAGELATCSSMVAQADGRLLLAGSDASRGFAARLLGSGERDPTFVANVVATAMDEATALAIGEDGSVLLAGRGAQGVTGALVMRLQQDGELDALFGNGGSTWIDLSSAHAAAPVVHDMALLADGRVLAAGGDLATWPTRPFLVRLLSEDGGDAPGVLGAMRSLVTAKEADRQAVVTARRMGGSTGSVSVAYRTAASSFPSAIAGQDYTLVSGRLDWGDGDVSDRQILVPIASNAAPEEHEYFLVALSDVQGDAGLGTRNVTVQIPADGDPAGQFALDILAAHVGEESGRVEVMVHRNYYSTGAVSVTLTPTSGTASAGDDFTATPVTVSWNDGEAWAKSATFTIANDTLTEQYEQFTIALSNPTGGAILGPRSSTVVTILPSDQPPPESRGGGRFGYLAVLLLGFVRFLRCRWGRQRTSN